jgi:hypothetical protein
MPLVDRGASPLANVLGITAVGPERGHQDGAPRVRRDEQRPHVLVEVRAGGPTVPAGEGAALVRGLHVPVVAPIGMQPGASKRRQAGREPQARRRGSVRSRHRHRGALRPERGRQRGVGREPRGAKSGGR